MIRRASKKDVPQIVWCNRTAIREGEDAGYGLPRDRQIFANEDRLRDNWSKDSVRVPNWEGDTDEEFVYVFEEGGRILGYTQVRIDSDSVELDTIDIAGGHQGKGIGTAMVQFVEDLARRLGKQYVTLGTSRNTETGKPWKSYGFWLKQGYTVVDEVETKLGKKYGFSEIRFHKKIVS